jgi:hypothetical protein
LPIFCTSRLEGSSMDSSAVKVITQGNTQISLKPRLTRYFLKAHTKLGI